MIRAFAALFGQRAFAVHIGNVLKQSPVPKEFSSNDKQRLVDKADQLASLLSQPALPAAQHTVHYTKRAEAIDRIEELHATIKAVAAGAVQTTDFNQFSEYLELAHPPPEVLDPTARESLGQAGLGTTNVSLRVVCSTPMVET